MGFLKDPQYMRELIKILLCVEEQQGTFESVEEYKVLYWKLVQ